MKLIEMVHCLCSVYYNMKNRTLWFTGKHSYFVFWGSPVRILATLIVVLVVFLSLSRRMLEQYYKLDCDHYFPCSF
jgi:hypothetical protein